MSLKHYDFLVDSVGPTNEIVENFSAKSPIDFFNIFFDKDVVNLIVTETNRYAQQKISAGIQQNSRLHRWKNTDAEEIRIFLLSVCGWV